MFVDKEEMPDGCPAVTESMLKVRHIQMELLRKLLEVCGRHGLNVWLDGGSLLGAVREKGYIPWNDDIDTIMLRADYDRLVGLANEFRPPFFLQCARTDRLYPRGHAQLRMDGTAAILPVDAKARAAFHQGIFIDIFVLDGVPQTEELRREAAAETLRLSKKLRVMCEYRPPRQFGPFIRRQLFRLKSFEKCFDEYEMSFKRWTAGDNARLCNWAMNAGAMETRGAIMRSWYGETVTLRFEGMDVPAPAGYDALLTTLYGDYMTPRKEPTCHGQVYFDTEHSYKDVLERWRKGEIDI